MKSLGVATSQATFFWLWRGVRNSSEMLPNPTFSTMNSSNYYLDLRGMDKNAYLQMKIGAIHRTPCPNLAFFQTYFLCHMPKYARLPQYLICVEIAWNFHSEASHQCYFQGFTILVTFNGEFLA